MAPISPVDNLIAWLDAYSKRHGQPLDPAGQLVMWPGQKPALPYAASATTKGRIELPRGTAAIGVMATSGFSSLVFTGVSSGFSYVNLPAFASGQAYSAPWAGALDSRGDLTIVSAAGQAGMVYVTAFPSVLPAGPLAAQANSSLPWISPNKTPVFGQRAGVGTTNLVAAVANQTVYLFGIELAVVVITAAGAGVLQDTSGTKLAEVRMDSIHEIAVQFNGAPLTIGRGIDLAIAGGGTVDGVVNFSQA